MALVLCLIFIYMYLLLIINFIYNNYYILYTILV